MTEELIKDLATRLLAARGSDSYHHMFRQVQAEMVRICLKQAGDNTIHAAKLLGVQRCTLVEMRRRFGLPLRTPGNRDWKHICHSCKSNIPVAVD